MAALLVGCGVGYTGYWWGWSSSRIPGYYETEFSKIDDVKKRFDDFNSEVDSEKAQLDKVAKTAVSLAGISERRVLWPEFMKAVTACLPKEPRPEKGEKLKPISQRNELHVVRMDCEYHPNLAEWFTHVQKDWKEQGSPTTTPKPPKPAAPAAADPDAEDAAATDGDATAVADAAAPPPAAVPSTDASGDAASGEAGGEAVASGVGPSGEGFVIEIYGHHYHNDADAGSNNRGTFVRNTFVKNLLTKQIELPVVMANGQTVLQKFTMNELGVDFPVVVYAPPVEQETIGEGGTRITDSAYTKPVGKTTVLQKAVFVVQFAWKPTAATERLNKRNQSQPAKAETELASVPNSEQGNTP